MSASLGGRSRRRVARLGHLPRRGSSRGGVPRLSSWCGPSTRDATGRPIALKKARQ
jgi:hypothetical protein